MARLALFSRFIQMYLKNPYFFDFFVYFWVFFAVFYNKKLKERFEGKQAKALAIVLSIVFSFSLVMLEYQRGKNILSVGGYLALLSGIIGWYYLWILLRKGANKAGNDAEEGTWKKIFTGILSAVFIIVILKQLFGLRIFKDSISKIFGDLFEIIGAWLYVALIILFVYSLFWLFSKLKLRGTAGADAAATENRMNQISEQINNRMNELQEGHNTLTEGLNQLGGNIENYEQGLAGIREQIGGFEGVWQNMLDQSIPAIVEQVREANSAGPNNAPQAANQTQQYADTLREYINTNLRDNQDQALQLARDMGQRTVESIENINRNYADLHRVIYEMRVDINEEEEALRNLGGQVDQFRNPEDRTAGQKMIKEMQQIFNQIKEYVKKLENKDKDNVAKLKDMDTEAITEADSEIKKGGHAVQTATVQVDTALKNITQKSDVDKVIEGINNTLKEINESKKANDKLNKVMPSKGEVLGLISNVKNSKQIMTALNKEFDKWRKQGQKIIKITKKEQIEDKKDYGFIKDIKEIFTVVWLEMPKISKSTKKIIKSTNKFISLVKKEKLSEMIKKEKQLGYIAVHIDNSINIFSGLDNILNKVLTLGSKGTGVENLSKDKKTVIKRFIDVCQGLKKISNEYKQRMEHLKKYIEDYKTELSANIDSNLTTKGGKSKFKGKINNISAGIVIIKDTRSKIAKLYKQLKEIRRPISNMNPKK